jgi:hypothetical protein
VKTRPPSVRRVLFLNALLQKRDSKVLANLSGEFVVDLYMTWDRRPLVLLRVSPPRMASALPNKNTTLLVEMLKKLGSLHTLRSSSV